MSILPHTYFILYIYTLQITRRQVESRIQPHNIEHGPIVCKVRIAFEKPNKPPDEVLRNRIQLNGIKPECCFNIHFRPPLLRTDSNGKCCIAILSILAVIISVLLQSPLQEEHSFHRYHHPHHHLRIHLIYHHHWIVRFPHRETSTKW